MSSCSMMRVYSWLTLMPIYSLFSLYLTVRIQGLLRKYSETLFIQNLNAVVRQKLNRFLLTTLSTIFWINIILEHYHSKTDYSSSELQVVLDGESRTSQVSSCSIKGCYIICLIVILLFGSIYKMRLMKSESSQLLLFFSPRILESQSILNPPLHFCLIQSSKLIPLNGKSPKSRQ